MLRYYLNGSDAYRLKLLLPLTPEMEVQIAEREARRAAEEAAQTVKELADGAPQQQQQPASAVL